MISDYVLQNEAVAQHNPADGATFSSFGSVDLPHVTGADGDSSFVAGDRAEVVTSRLGGRRSGQPGSRAASSMSSATDDIG